MKRVGFCYHSDLAGAHSLAEELASQARAAGTDAWLAGLGGDDVEEALSDQVTNSSLIVCVGGDGTVLHTSEIAARYETPVFGVRIGRLGFLCEVTGDEAPDALKRILDGEGQKERRSMVHAQLSDDESRESWSAHALNDVVIGRRGLGRTISVGARINGVLIAEYRADAVIVATATGSTGYALSVGGPILHPSADDMVLIPVAPHLSRANALVLPAGSSIQLEVARGFETHLSVDGQVELPVSSGAVVHVTRSERTVEFLRLGDGNEFYFHLARRLGWLRLDHVLDELDSDIDRDPE